MASPNMLQPVFPDVHHKMSKKIAQLTKVIYHLNTKNEDHEAEMQAMAEHHRYDVERILKDAAKKIGRFKEQLEVRRGELDAEARLKRLQEKYDREKRECLAEFASLRAGADERETALNREWKRRTEPMREELQSLRARIQVLVGNFESETRRLKMEAGDRTAQSARRLNEVVAEKEEELAEMVRTTSEKYQKMLAQQLRAQDALRESMKQEQAQLVAEHEQALGRQRAELDGEHATELGDIRRQNAKELRRAQEEVSENRRMVAEDMRQVQERYQRALEAKSSSEASLAELQTRLQQVQGDFEKLEKDARDAALEAESTERMLKARVSELTEGLEAKDRSNVQLGSRSQEVQQELEQIRKQRDDLLTVKSHLEKTIALERERLQAQEQSTRQQLREAQTRAAEQDRVLRETTSRADELDRALAAVRDTALAEGEQLRSRLRGLHVELETAKTSHQQHVKSSRERIEELETALRGARQEAQAKLGDMSAIATTRAEELRKANEAFTATLGIMESRVKDGEAALASLEARRQSDLAALAERLEASLREAEEKHQLQMAEKVADWDQERKGLAQRLRQATITAEAEAEEMRQKNAELEKQLRSFSGSLDASRTEERRLAALTEALKAQIADLRRELQDSKNAAEASLEKQLRIANEAWEGKLAERLRRTEESSRAAVSEAEKSKRLQIDQYRAELQRQLAESLSKADDKVQEMERRQQELLDEKTSLTDELEKSQADSEAALEKLRKQAARDLETTRKQRDDALAALSREKEHDMSKAIQSLQSQHSAEKTALLEQFEKARADALEQREASVRSEEHASMAKRLREVRTEHESKMRLLQEGAEKEKDEVQAAMQLRLASSESRLEELQTAFDAESRRRAAAMQEVSAQQESIAGLERRIEDLEANHARTLENMRSDAVARESYLVEAQRRALEDERRSHRESKRRIQEESSDLQGSLEMKISCLHGEIEALEARYLARESRPEDVARIRELSQELRKKEALVAKHREEMAYFKRELLNREEMYNRRFGKSPTVGVMQVLKPAKQDSRGNLSQPAQRKPSMNSITSFG